MVALPRRCIQRQARSELSREARKEPSGPSLYEIFAVDAYTSSTKLAHIGRVAALPDDPSPPPSDCGLPPYIIINWMVPNYPPSGLLAPKKTNGPGWNLVQYCRLSDRVREILGGGGGGGGGGCSSSGGGGGASAEAASRSGATTTAADAAAAAVAGGGEHSSSGGGGGGGGGGGEPSSSRTSGGGRETSEQAGVNGVSGRSSRAASRDGGSSSRRSGRGDKDAAAAGGGPLPAIDLLRRFMHATEGAQLRGDRLKCILGLADTSRVPFNVVLKQMILRYNFKPFLSRTASLCYHGVCPETSQRYFEVDIDIHAWGHAPLTAFNTVKEKLPVLLLRGGVVIEAEAEAEMPEVLLAALYMSNIDPKRARRPSATSSSPTSTAPIITRRLSSGGARRLPPRRAPPPPPVARTARAARPIGRRRAFPRRASRRRRRRRAPCRWRRICWPRSLTRVWRTSRARPPDRPRGRRRPSACADSRSGSACTSLEVRPRDGYVSASWQRAPTTRARVGTLGSSYTHTHAHTTAHTQEGCKLALPDAGGTLLALPSLTMP